MTRRSDLMCEDLFGCTHEPETPVVEQGEIIYWLCRCGKRAEWPGGDDPEELLDDRDVFGADDD